MAPMAVSPHRVCQKVLMVLAPNSQPILLMTVASGTLEPTQVAPATMMATGTLTTQTATRGTQQTLTMVLEDQNPQQFQLFQKLPLPQQPRDLW